MTRRIFLYAGLGLAMAIFVATLTTGVWWKRPPGGPDRMVDLMKTVSEHVLAERWQEAAEAADSLQREWDRSINRLATGTERRARHEVGEAIARLGATLHAQDRSLALVEIATLRYRWRQLGI